MGFRGRELRIPWATVVTSRLRNQAVQRVFLTWVSHTLHAKPWESELRALGPRKFTVLGFRV